MSNIHSTKGYFNAAGLEFKALASTESNFTFKLEVPDGKDQFTVFISVMGGKAVAHSMICLGQNGYPDKEFKLTTSNFNAVRIPTLGYTDKDGKATFIFASAEGSVSSNEVSVAATNHIDAVNN
jgi:hypothetical protein